MHSSRFLLARGLTFALFIEIFVFVGLLQLTLYPSGSILRACIVLTALSGVSLVILLLVLWLAWRIADAELTMGSVPTIYDSQLAS